jgi:uncharacterized protein YabE (DUF348 family)
VCYNLNMPRRIYYLIAVFVILVGAGFVLFGSRRPIQLVVDGTEHLVWTNALTVGGALEDAEVTITSGDLVQPAVQNWLGGTSEVKVTHARVVNIQTSSGMVSIWSVERTPEKILAQAGVSLAVGDRVLWNGRGVELDQPLIEADAYYLQVVPAVEVTLLTEDGSQRKILAAGTLAEGLWLEKIRLNRQDSLSFPLGKELTSPVTVFLRQSFPVTIQMKDKIIQSHSSAATVGQALAEAGVSLQGLDYSIPAEDQPLPTDGIIRVVTVREEILLDQAGIPFKNEYVADANLELDQRTVIEAGLEGIQVSRIRVRYEDGVETGRVTESTWNAREPQNAKVGYGTKIVIRTIQTPDGTIEYWRSFRVYATSYHPCGFIVCSYVTASGEPLKKGAVAVNEAWWPYLKGMYIYVDGYGPGKIVDWGRYINYWVDLGYSDEDFKNWHQYTTVYFTTPVPANVPWILP